MKYKFDSPEEMLMVIQNGNDLYSPSELIYTFVYNEAGSICCYWLRVSEAQELERYSIESDGEYWGAFLGIGGHIYDDPSYDFYDPDWSVSNLDFCKEYYRCDWIDCRDILMEECL